MAELDIKKAEELEKKYDSGLQTRVIGPYLVKFTYYFSIFLRCTDLHSLLYQSIDSVEVFHIPNSS